MDNLNLKKFKHVRDNIFKKMDQPELNEDFSWPEFQHFNWVNDWFDSLIDRTNDALVIINEQSVQRYTYRQLISSSSQIANWMKGNDINRGDMIFLHLDNRVELFQVILGAIRVGAIIVPCSTSLPIKEIETRLEECEAKFIFFTQSEAHKFDHVPENIKRVVVDSEYNDFLCMQNYQIESDVFEPITTLATDPLFAYFTSGSTSRPKLVFHSHQSYPVGHLTSLLWNGTRVNDKHFNLSPPGWAKHSWSSLFVPWNAEATNVVTNIKKITPQQVMAILNNEEINTFCAPPTFWRALFLQNLDSSKPDSLREIVSAGESLEPTLIHRIKEKWGIFLRNGYGQTEATAIIGQLPGVKVIVGSIGKALPGYRLKIVDINTGLLSKRGELCIELGSKPTGVMIGYNSTSLNETAFKDGLYHTSDICHVDRDGNYYLEGRIDNVFKSFDFRVSPYELEFILQEIEAVAEVAVVPSPCTSGGAVPRAYIVTRDKNYTQIAQTIFKHANLLFPSDFLLDSLIICDSLPLTQTGKINREQLRLSALEPSISTDVIFMNPI